MIETFLARRVLPAAYDVLPAAMASPPASALLVAIALQESGAAARRQRPSGPARGFWQFELSGVAGVRWHKATAQPLRAALAALCYPTELAGAVALATLEHNDVLAAVFARLLLWTVPAALPTRLDVAPAWDQYLEAWRPGKPRPDEWAANYALGWSIATSAGGEL